jgi:hypothetical protein
MNDAISRSEINAEFARLRLRPEDMPGGGLAFANQHAVDEFLSHLRTLSPGAAWHDVFGGLVTDGELDDAESLDDPGYPLGPFDYPDAPRGSAIFASLELEGHDSAATAALERVAQLGIPIFGSGLVRDRGQPHLYVVLPIGAPGEHADAIADFLREQPGVLNAYPWRLEPTADRGT